jgi:hypothetical protein
VRLDGRPQKIIDSWNKILVVAASLAQALGNQYAAIGTWDSQPTAPTVTPNRPSNLYEPVETEPDYVVHGLFEHQAHGLLTPSFLKSLRKTSMTFGRAVGNTVKDKKRRS